MFEGLAGFEWSGNVIQLESNAATIIEAHVPHRLINLGNSRFRIVWISASVDANRALLTTGESHRVEDET